MYFKKLRDSKTAKQLRCLHFTRAYLCRRAAVKFCEQHYVLKCWKLTIILLRGTVCVEEHSANVIRSMYTKQTHNQKHYGAQEFDEQIGDFVDTENSL